jgi:ketosteroid isomerase-like protein
MKNLMRSLFVIAAVLSLVLVTADRPVRASVSTDMEFISFLEEAWVNAIVTKNVKVLDRMMADDFSGVSASGAPYTKQEAISDVTSGYYKVEKMEMDNLKVRVFGDFAIATYYQNEKSNLGGEERSGRYIFTDVWVNTGDDWKAVSSHGTPVELP